jgi:hypothetical protein
MLLIYKRSNFQIKISVILCLATSFHSAIFVSKLAKSTWFKDGRRDTKQVVAPVENTEFRHWNLIMSSKSAQIPWRRVIVTMLYSSLCRYQWSRYVGRNSTTACCLGLPVESRRGHGCLSIVIFVRCQVEASAMGRSPVLKSLTGWVWSYNLKSEKA